MLLSLLLSCTLSSAWAGPACAPTVDALVLPDDLSSADPRLQGDAVVVVTKAARSLGLYQDGVLVQLSADQPACWQVGLAAGYPPGTKLRRGDRKTPEGWYRTSDKPWSSFYGAIAVHYPDAGDAAAGLAAGRIDRATHDRIVAADRAGRKTPQDTALGGEILIHGGGGRSDWTLGCVALDDDQLDALRARLPAGMKTDVLILP